MTHVTFGLDLRGEPAERFCRVLSAAQSKVVEPARLCRHRMLRYLLLKALDLEEARLTSPTSVIPQELMR